jgi:hypothetical protein
VLSLTSSSAISAAATSGFRVNLQLLLGICASDEDSGHDAAPAATPQPWDQPAPAAPAYAAPPQQQPWAAPAPQGGYDMTRAIPHRDVTAAIAAAQPQPDPSAYV